MFEINKFRYVDKNTKNKFDIYVRHVELADELAKRITDLGVFDLRRAKIGFCKKMVSDIPPYEVEQEQIKTIEEWEEHTKNEQKKNLR